MSKDAEREIREKQYATEVHKKSHRLTKADAWNILTGQMREKISPPTSGVQRKANFLKLEENNFKYPGDPFGEDVSGWPRDKHVRHSLMAYKTLLRYSLTDYGAMMVAAVLKDNRKPTKSFLISTWSRGDAGANTDIMFLARDFGTTGKDPLRFGGNSLGQKVDPLAVIHHEFRHTRFWGKKRSEKEDLLKERDAVLWNENPVRIINGLEPRYTYFDPEDKQTINIADKSAIASGPKDVRFDDIKVLVERGHKDSLYKHTT